MNPFRLLHTSKKSHARVGELTTAHGKVQTPFFMTIATRGAVKTLAAEDMRALGAPIILSNTYHLFVRPGMEIFKKAGGLHKFMGWQGPILTDSGGYQVFSLATKNKSVANREVDYDVRITNDGAEFIDRLSGRKDLFTPERVLEIQQVIGSDIAMVLDVCAPNPISYGGAKEAMEMTTEWAVRAASFAGALLTTGLAVTRDPELFSGPEEAQRRWARLIALAGVLAAVAAGLLVGSGAGINEFQQ